MQMKSPDISEFIQNANNNLTVEYLPILITFGIILIFGLVGNMVSVAFYGFMERRKERKNVTYLLLTALSINDFTGCLSECSLFYEMTHLVLFNSRPGCIALYFFNHCFVLNSLLLLLFIAVDRHQKICCDNQKWQFSIKTAKKCLVGISVCSFIVACKNFYIIDITEIRFTNERNDTYVGFYCSHSYKLKKQTTIFVFDTIDATFLFTTTIFILFLYKRIVQKIIHAEKQLEKYQINRCDKFKQLQTSCQESRTEVNNYNIATIESGIARNCVPASVVGLTSLSGLQLDDHKGNISTDCNQRQPARLNFARHVLVEENVIEGPSSSDIYEQEGRSKPAKKIAHDERIRNAKIAAERTIVIMMIAVTLASIFPFWPYFYVCFFVKPQTVRSGTILNLPEEFGYRTYILFCTVNPYIIGLTNSKYRHFVKSIILRCFRR